MYSRNMQYNAACKCYYTIDHTQLDRHAGHTAEFPR